MLLSFEEGVNENGLDAFFRRMKQAVVLVNPGKKQRTGVIIRSDGLVFTCLEPLEGSETTIVRREGQDISAHVVDQNEGLNIAILQLEFNKEWDYVDFAPPNTLINAGMHVLSISYSHGAPPKLASAAHVAFPDVFSGDPENHDGVYQTRGWRFMSDFDIIANDSSGFPISLPQCPNNTHIIQIINMHGDKCGLGAPVFNTIGQVIGLYMGYGASMDFAVHYEHLREVINTYPNNKHGGG